MPYYLNPINEGLSKISTKGTGETITLKWNRAFPNTAGNSIAYNIYFSEDRVDFPQHFFNQSPAFVSIDGSLTVDITDLTPGQIYRAAIRAVEYNPLSFDFSLLPTAFNGLKTYPEGQLASDIDEDDLIIPLVDVSEFPSSGVVRLGSELIAYSSVDDINNTLNLTGILQRGYQDSIASIHTVDNYDGYYTWDFGVLFWPVVVEEQNTVVFQTESRFDWDNYAFTLVDGYRQATKDIVNPNMDATDAANEDFPPYDTAGWRRIDLASLLNGDCVGSYFGGEYGCIDGYGVSHRLRGLSVQDMNTQREEQLLSVTGEPVVLVKRQWTGIRCFCITNNQEHPDARCKKCYGCGFVVGYNQHFNLRRADGRIMVRFEPWVDTLPLVESGLDVQGVKPAAWTIVLPTIHPRDFIVRFGQDGNEEFRYEVVQVSRNMMFNQEFGAQKFNLQRIRKTDIIYSVPVFRDISNFAGSLTVSPSLSLGIPLHTHTIMTNDKPPSGWNQLTSTDAGHNHSVIWDADSGTIRVSEELGHSHTIL